MRSARIVILLSAFAACVQTQAGAQFGWAAGGPWRAANAKASPDSAWVAEREACQDGCLDTVLAIRRPDEPVDGSHALFYVPDDGSVIFKWVDGAHLLVAARKQSEIEAGPRRFRDVSVEYSVYPDDPDLARQGVTRIVRRERRAADFRFESPEAQAPVQTRGCQLRVSFDGVAGMEFGISAGKHLDFDAPPPPAAAGKPSREAVERWIEQFRQSARGARPTSYGVVWASGALPQEQSAEQVTSGSVGPVRFSSPFYRVDRGRLPQRWYGRREVDGAAVSALLAAMDAGVTELRLASWLDGSEDVFSIDGPARRKAVEDFRRCVSEKSIFEGG